MEEEKTKGLERSRAVAVIHILSLYLSILSLHPFLRSICLGFFRFSYDLTQPWFPIRSPAPPSPPLTPGISPRRRGCALAVCFFSIAHYDFCVIRWGFLFRFVGKRICCSCLVNFGGEKSRFLFGGSLIGVVCLFDMLVLLNWPAFDRSLIFPSLFSP